MRKRPRPRTEVKIVLRAAGAMRSGPERGTVDDYLRRAEGLARGTGFLGVEEQEVAPKGKSDPTAALLDGVPGGAKLVVLDERGKAVTSRGIAKALSAWRDAGVGACVVVVGPADGFDKSQLPPGVVRWSFGLQTWPHKLVRVMAAEQLFRALGILAGTPYHRD